MNGAGEWAFEAWVNQTRLHPLGLTLTVLCGLAVLLLQRRLAVTPFIVMACVIAPAQRLVIAGLDFNLIRVLVLFGIVRVLARGEHRGVRWMSLDTLVVVFAVARTAAYTMLHGSGAALIFQGGQTFDSVGLYFLFRCLVREPRDIVRAAVGFVVLSVPVAVAFLLENRTGRNAFAFFGGVPAMTLVREGRMRCQGAFAHPIIAGCFWAGALPMIAALWWQGGVNRFWAFVGLLTCLGIIVLTASSTPLMGVLFAGLGGMLFLGRWWMRYLVMTTALLLVALHLSMKAPVWHLISRITIAKGNTGYHRFQLIDNAIHRFNEWALVGTTSTAHWFWGAQDVTNQYILEAVRGGAATLVLFMATIWICFRYVGLAWRSIHDRPTAILAWSLGVSLWVHCTNFIGVSYFGQGVFIWYLNLAMIASLREWSSSRLRHGEAAAGVPAMRSAVQRRESQSGYAAHPVVRRARPV